MNPPSKDPRVKKFIDNYKGMSAAMKGTPRKEGEPLTATEAEIMSRAPSTLAKVREAINIMDESGRKNPEGNSLMLFESSWNDLRGILLALLGEAPSEPTPVGRLCACPAEDRPANAGEFCEDSRSWTCKECGGRITRADLGLPPEPAKCETCDGKGFLPDELSSAMGGNPWKDCPDCAAPQGAKPGDNLKPCPLCERAAHTFGHAGQRNATCINPTCELCDATISVTAWNALALAAAPSPSPIEPELQDAREWIQAMNKVKAERDAALAEVEKKEKRKDELLYACDLAVRGQNEILRRKYGGSAPEDVQGILDAIFVLRQEVETLRAAPSEAKPEAGAPEDIQDLAEALEMCCEGWDALPAKKAFISQVAGDLRAHRCAPSEPSVTAGDRVRLREIAQDLEECHNRSDSEWLRSLAKRLGGSEA